MLCFLKCQSDALDVVAREGAKEARPLAGADVPAIVALFQHADGFALLQLQLVVVLRLVVVQGSIQNGIGGAGVDHEAAGLVQRSTRLVLLLLLGHHFGHGRVLGLIPVISGGSAQRSVGHHGAAGRRSRRPGGV